MELWVLVICVSTEVFLFVCPVQSVVARGLLNSIQESAGYLPVYINFSTQTSSARTQEIIESKLEKKRKNILGIGSQLHCHKIILSYSHIAT